MGADVSSPGPWVRAASGWSRQPLFLRFGTTACNLASALMLFPTTVLEFPLSPLPAPQLTFTKPHCRPSYRDPASTKGHHPRAWSPSHLPRETCLWLCPRPAAAANASLRSGTRCFLFSSLYLPKLQVCLFLMEVLGWYMYVINIWM